MISIWIITILCIQFPRYTKGRLVEHERIEEYHKRGHTWPPSPEEFKPKTAGWRKLMERRLEQIQYVDDLNQKYNAYLNTIYSGLMVQNFTENGWGLTRAPQYLVDEFRSHLHHGLVHNRETEGVVPAIGGSEMPGYEPLMIVDENLNRRALEILKPIHEAWANTALTGNNAYGLRVYKNNSNLNMHIDKSQTHVISSILHIDHDPMSEPWPIVIEDFQGNLNEVFLESGDLLLYESSKCFHGRPKRFNGSWYTSLFIHYFPSYWNTKDVTIDTHYRVPPTWSSKPEKTLNKEDQLTVVGTSIKEPNCKDEWCALESSTKWDVRSLEGKVFSNDAIQKNLFHDEL